jgi:hypothetical protein
MLAHQMPAGSSPYAEYTSLRWVPGRASYQEAAPLYRPQPQYGMYAVTLGPQPHQMLGRRRLRQAAAPQVLAITPAHYRYTGPIGPRNTERDFASVAQAPRAILPGANVTGRGIYTPRQG